MKRLDPRTPVLVGGGQITVGTGTAPEPVDLLTEAARAAAADAGAALLLDEIDSIRAVRMFSRSYPDPGRLVAERLGRGGARTVYTAAGGQMPQVLVDRSASDIVAGRADVVLIGGAESWRTRNAAKARGETLDWSRQPPSVRPDATIGEELTPASDHEIEIGISDPTQIYPLFDVALRHRGGLTVGQHRDEIAGLWSAFSRVAAMNPHAAVRRSFSADEIKTAAPTNRMISFPYTKLLNSNNSVDQAAALLMCSAERADALGISRDRWVFLHGAAEGDDTTFVSNRRDFTSSDPIRMAGRTALSLAGVGIDDIAHVDLYSCFPSAVQIAARELGLGLDRQLTVTGGLTFAGGPWNNYVTHSIAALIDVLRADPGALGLCTANGGMLTKHAVAVYSTNPAPAGIRWTSVQAALDARPAVACVTQHAGSGTIETYTVTYDRGGTPSHGYTVLRIADGSRAWATTTHPGLLGAMTSEEWCGRSVDVHGTELVGVA